MRKALFAPLARNPPLESPISSYLGLLPAPKGSVGSILCVRYTARAYSAETAFVKQSQTDANAPKTSTAFNRQDHHGKSRQRSSSLLLLQTGVGQKSQADDFQIWIELLRERTSLCGFEGISQTWTEFKAARLGLPNSSSSSHAVWLSFLREPRLRPEVVNHALDLQQQTGQPFDSFYAIVIGMLLQKPDLRQANYYHEGFLQHGVISSGALVELAKATILATPDSLLLFWLRAKLNKLPKEICRGLYDVIIPRFCLDENWKLALTWHKYLINRGDTPKQSNALLAHLASQPSLEHALFRHAGLQNTKKRHSSTSSVRQQQDSGHEADRLEHSYSQAHAEAAPSTPSTKTAEISPHGIQVNDAFCARLFATHAVPTSLIVAGLKVFKVDSIGPLALRELAARSQSGIQILEDIQILRKEGISIGSSVFARLIKKLSLGRQQVLLNNLLSSDIHPDAFEDPDLQKRLLAQYLAQDDWASTQRTLAVLELHRIKPNAIRIKRSQTSQRVTEEFTEDNSPWTSRFNEYCIRRDTNQLAALVETMLASRLTIPNNCYFMLWKYCLRSRSPGMRPTCGPGKRLDLPFVANICLRALESGEVVPPWILKEIIIRYGMLLDLRNLSRLCVRFLSIISLHKASIKVSGTAGRHSLLELARSPGPKLPIALTTTLPANHPLNYCHQVITHNTIRAIVSWGFLWGGQKIYHKYMAGHHRGSQIHGRKRRILRNPDPPVPRRTYLRGLLLLQKLHKEGLNIEVKMVAGVVKERLWQLYGIGRSKLRRNRWIRFFNPFTLEEMLVEIETNWNGPRLFPELYARPVVPPTSIVERTSTPGLDRDSKCGGESDSNSINGGLDELLAILDIKNPKEPSQIPREVCLDSTPRRKGRGQQEIAKSLLGGLLDTSVCPESPPLTRDERVKARMDLRFALFGANGLGRWEKENKDREIGKQDWHRFVAETAIRTDDELVRRGLITERPGVSYAAMRSL